MIHFRSRSRFTFICLIYLVSYYTFDHIISTFIAVRLQNQASHNAEVLTVDYMQTLLLLALYLIVYQIYSFMLMVFAD